LKNALSSDGVYFKRAGPKFQQIQLGLNETPAAEHLAHRIGYVLKPFPVHRLWNYAIEAGHERLVRPHAQLFEQRDDQDEHDDESQRCKRRNGYPEQVRENSGDRSPFMGHIGGRDNTLTTGFCSTWSSAFTKPKEKRSKKWKDYGEA
jgi:hypothetical protein